MLENIFLFLLNADNLETLLELDAKLTLDTIFLLYIPLINRIIEDNSEQIIKNLQENIK